MFRISQGSRKRLFISNQSKHLDAVRSCCLGLFRKNAYCATSLKKGEREKAALHDSAKGAANAINLISLPLFPCRGQRGRWTGLQSSPSFWQPAQIPVMPRLKRVLRTRCREMNRNITKKQNVTGRLSFLAKLEKERTRQTRQADGTHLQRLLRRCL